MAMELDPKDPSLLACPECRGHGYVIGEVRPCRREECVRAKAVEILEEGQGSGKDRGADPFDALGGLLKGNTEFRKLAGSFVMGGLAGVVAKLGSDLLTEVAKKEEKTGGSLKLPKLLPYEPPVPTPSAVPARAKMKPSRRRKS